MPAILWLRRDLRVHDHPALRSALDAHERVAPVFCLDDRLLHGRHASGARTQFLLESLADLDAEFARRGARLAVRHGPTEHELPALAEEIGATELFYTADAGPFARSRDAATTKALEAAGVRVRALPGLFCVDDLTAVRTGSGGHYSVFSPFYRRWSEHPRRDVLAAPRKIELPPKLRIGRLPSLASLGLEQEVEEPPEGGASAGRRRMRAFIRAKVRDYERGQDDLAGDGTSRLSPYLHLGCISPRELEDALPRRGGADAFRRQLAWRDFYAHLLRHRPQLARDELRDAYRGTIEWEDDREALTAWQEGRTGYPLVDAAMRQLRREGWMHNRARLVVGSFLTKDLGIDWREGERWFMRLLVDGDEAQNNGNWQWIASVGVDPQPPARRIYNPSLQRERHDPDGSYVRRFVPELRNVPDEHLDEPWGMPDDVAERAGCVIGRDYPAPIVDHREARRAAIARYAAARSA